MEDLDLEVSCQQPLFAIISHQALKTLQVPNQHRVNVLLRALHRAVQQEFHVLSGKRSRSSRGDTS